MKINNTSDVSPECETDEIERTFNAFVALDNLVKNRNHCSLVWETLPAELKSWVS